VPRGHVLGLLTKALFNGSNCDATIMTVITLAIPKCIVNETVGDDLSKI